MARADLLKRIFSSFIQDDKELFLRVASEIVEDERKKLRSTCGEPEDDTEQ